MANIRSIITLSNSIFNLNKTKSNGGSISVQHSMTIVQSSTFESESVFMGYGGAIFAENVANVTLRNHLFTTVKLIMVDL